MTLKLSESGQLAEKIRAVLRGVSLGLLAATTSAGVAVAAAASRDKPQILQEVVVTGSRIATPELETFAPTLVITSAALENTGTINVATSLRDLPSVGT